MDGSTGPIFLGKCQLCGTSILRTGGLGMEITSEQLADAFERVNILTAQIGNARIRKMHKEPLIKFLKLVEQQIKKENK